MAQLELPNGKYIDIPDNATEEQKQKFLDKIKGDEQFTNPEYFKGSLADAPDALKNNWLYDNLFVAPYEGARKGLNSGAKFIEGLGDTIGKTTGLGGFRYGEESSGTGYGVKGVMEYVPYQQAVKEGNVMGMFPYITGYVGKEDASQIEGFFYGSKNIDTPNDNTTSLTGRFVEGATQFLIGFKGIDKIGKATGALNAVTKAGKLAEATAVGAGADLISFDGTEGRFTDMLAHYFPSVHDSFLSYLETDKDDSFWEGRFKNSLEGLGLGLFAEVLFLVGKSGAGAVKGKLDTLQAKRDAVIIEQSQQAIKDVQTQLDEATTIGDKMKIINDSLSKVEGLKPPKPLKTETKVQVLNRIIKEDLTINYEKWKAGELDAEDAFGLPLSWINLDTIDASQVSKDFVETLVAMRNVVGESFEKVSRDFREEVIKNKAISEYGGDLNKVYYDFKQLAKDIEGTGALIYAHEIQLNSLVKALPALMRQVKRGARPQKDVDMALAYIFDMQKNRTGVATNTGGNLSVFGMSKKDFDNLKIVQENLDSAINELNFFGKDKKGNTTQLAKERFLDKITVLDNPTVTRKVLNFVTKNKTWEVLNEVWINALLSNPKTIIGNVLSNWGFAYGRSFEDMMGAKLSAYLNKSEIDKATVFKRQYNEAKATMAGLTSYLGDSVKLGLQTLKTGELILEGSNGLSKLDTATTKGVPTALGGGVVRIPSRLLNTGDEIFKQLNYRSKVNAMAISKADELGLKGKEFKKFIDEYFQDSFDEFGRGTNAEALAYARENTFTNELTGFVAKFQSMVNDYPILKQAFPFIRTPYQIAKAVIDRTPFALGYNWKHILGQSNNPVMIARARGQFMMGTILMSSAYALAQFGMLNSSTNRTTGSFDWGNKTGDGKVLNKFTDAELLRMKKSDLNFKPYSIVIGDTQIPFGRLDPFGAFLGLIADINTNYDRLKQEELEALGAVGILHLMSNMPDPTTFADKIGIGIQATASAVRDNVLSKTYLQQVHDVVATAMSGDDRKWKKFAVQKVGSYIPNIVNKLTNDQYLRHAYTILDEVKKRTGMGEPISPRYNFLGEAHKNPEGDFQRFFNNFVNPVPVGEVKKDIITSELLRLGTAPEVYKPIHNNVDYTQYKFGKLTALDRLNQLLTTTKIDGLTLRQKLEQTIGSDTYKSMSDPIKADGGISDIGGKAYEIKRLTNLYKDEVEATFRKEKNKFKFIDDEKRNLHNDENKQKINKREIENNSRTSQTLKERLQPLQNF